LGHYKPFPLKIKKNLADILLSIQKRAIIRIPAKDIELKMIDRTDIAVLYSFVFHAGVAQLVEQLICNQPVGGSNPFASLR
jgi:hypothetical protein